MEEGLDCFVDGDGETHTRHSETGCCDFSGEGCSKCDGWKHFTCGYEFCTYVCENCDDPYWFQKTKEV